jgi:CRP/FNR family transcriptional regulator
MHACNCDSCRHTLCAKKVPIFSFLSDEELLKIIGMTGHKYYKKGEKLCSEGDKSNSLFILNEGQVKASKFTRDGKEQIVHIYTSGDFFGELSLFNPDQTYNFDVYAISDVKICTLAKEDMDRILMSNPEISIKLLQEITRRLTETENLAQNLATNDAEIRIAYILLEFAEKYGIPESNGSIIIKLPVNREAMANYAGVTRETISRKLNALEEDGIISLIGNKSIVINQPDALRSLVE